MKNNSNKSRVEIILGIVSPIGTNKDIFETLLKQELKSNHINFQKIEVTKKLVKIKRKMKLPKSLEYFLKMQICSTLRDKYLRGVLILNILSEIQRKRSKLKNSKPVVYLIDQLKNISEYKILKHIYGKNYFQVSLFSSESARDFALEKQFESDPKFNESSFLKHIKSNYSLDIPGIKNFLNKDKIEQWLKEYENEILKDCSHMLILKDFDEISEDLKSNDSGQQVGDLFHLSNYFINLDADIDFVTQQTKSFVNLLLGKNMEHPSQDEFGMSLAYQGSVRSNFPGDRQVGSSIISEFGEVISVASIRAPSKTSNPTLYDEHKIEPGYKDIKKNI